MIWFSTAMLFLSLAILVLGDRLFKRWHKQLSAEIETARTALITEFGDPESIQARVRDMARNLACVLRERAELVDSETAARLRAAADAVEQVANRGRARA